MDGITEARGNATERWTLTEEMIIWLLFSVLISLAYFGLTLLVWWIIEHKVDYVELLKSGGLVTYASTLASKTAGEYFKAVSRRTLMTPFCVFGLVGILLSTAGVYGALLSLGTTASRLPGPNLGISPPSSCRVFMDRCCRGSRLWFQLHSLRQTKRKPIMSSAIVWLILFGIAGSLLSSLVAILDTFLANNRTRRRRIHIIRSDETISPPSEIDVRQVRSY